MLESKPWLPSSFWKPATKNGQIHSWRGLSLELTTSQYFMHFNDYITFQTSYLAPICWKQYLLALVYFHSLYESFSWDHSYFWRETFCSPWGHLRVIQLVGSFWYLRRLWSSPGHKTAQFYPPTCNSSIFREEIRNSQNYTRDFKTQRFSVRWGSDRTFQLNFTVFLRSAARV